MSLTVKKLLSGNGLTKNNNLNNAIILVGGLSVAYIAYNFFMKPREVVIPKSTNKNIDASTGKQYPHLSMMARSFEGTETTPPPTPPDTTTIKKNILSMILNNAQNISTVIGNIDTLNAKIETYTAQLQQVLQQKAAGVLTQYQVDQYTRQLVIDIAGALEIQLVPYFTGTTGTNDDGSTGIPGYYNDYQSYLNELYKRYYDYYQPSYQYYPGQQYQYYQPYQYQYPYPYMSNTQYPGTSSYGFAQNYYPYTQQYQQQYQQQNPYANYYGYGQQYQDPYAYLYGGQAGQPGQPGQPGYSYGGYF